ncbi:hypothetical protein [Caldisericum exile]|uniref:Uncharacterized protein n=1 Tax=Caldisericum exile (strain DSM 21853 / NBRC 104410 / AZM16c01) TaxID=511051 RepID=A0A7U6GFW2_CALEA|nr:hypothetical protein [Caldisericum exile]BAL81647.1 hypothetical protein CSE_15210 [Caldisericum exile AZM16c01]
MADFFDKLKKGAKEATEKAGILAKITGLKAQIGNINLKKDGLFKELGKVFFNEVKAGTFKEELKESLKKVVDEIDALDSEIAKLNGEIAKLNEDLKKVSEKDAEIKEATPTEQIEEPKQIETKPEEPPKENKNNSQG